MRCLNRVSALLTLGFAALPLQAAAPVSAYTNYARYESAQISPGGKYLALTQRLAEGEVMTVVGFPQPSLAGGSSFGRYADVSAFHWSDDSRILVQTARRLPGLNRNSFPTGEIHGLDFDGKNGQVLFASTAGRGRTTVSRDSSQPVYTSAQVIDTLKGDSDNVLVQTFGFGPDLEAQGTQRMNVRTGKLQRVSGSPVAGGNFFVDSQDRPVFVSGIDQKGETRLYRRNEEKRDWLTVATFPAGAGVLLPVGETGQPDTWLAIDSAGGNTAGVVEWNSRTGEKRELHRNPDADLVPLPRDVDGKAWAFAYTNHFPEYWYPDPAHPLAQMHQSLRATFPASNISFTSTTDDLSLAVAKVHGPQLPPTFVVVDVTNRKLLQRVSAYPHLKPEDLSPTDPFELRARDGLQIRGYVTTPAVGNRKALPTVVMVHGGPHGVQDSYGFDPVVQLLASRGYAVLQVNFRGSAGRGREFESAGHGHWGTRMQDDISDAVTWAVADGVTDRNRVCIMGSGYGAYAALTGTFREPGMFRCAVGISGTYDLPLAHRQTVGFPPVPGGDPWLRQAVANDADALAQRSPVQNADRIKAAVLLIHGKEDFVAPFVQAERMREALQKAGQSPEMVELSSEPEAVASKEAVTVETWEKVLAFLGRNLAGATP